jgi:hypothetical protein
MRACIYLSVAFHAATAPSFSIHFHTLLFLQSEKMPRYDFIIADAVFGVIVNDVELTASE